MNKKIIWGIVVVVVIVIIGYMSSSSSPIEFLKQEEEINKNQKGLNNNAETPVISTWKTYNSTRSDYSFDYPSILSVKQNYTESILTHSIPFKHPDPCDFKGDAPPLEILTDFRVSLEVINLSAKSIAQSSNYPGWDYVSKNPFTLGDLSGYKVQSGVEGCGENLYYFTLSSTKTLVIHQKLITELNSIVSDYQSNLKLPGIITPTLEQEFIVKILSSFKFTK